MLVGNSIPRGSGLSYAAASFGDGGLSIDHTKFNRLLDFDSSENIIEVEAGISLAALFDFLAARCLYLPVQPGHGRITVGGSIAANVHGKNQTRDGTFMDQIVSLTLFHPDHGLLDISRGQEPKVFDLTCGGYGLTGHILKVRLRAKPFPCDRLEQKTIIIEDMVSGADQLHRHAKESDFVFSWHNCLLGGEKFGRGFVRYARFSPLQDFDPPAPIGEPPALDASARCSWRLPMVNTLTARIMNSIYFRQEARVRKPQLIPLQKAIFPLHNKQVYFWLYGTKGFHEYQVIVPRNCFAEFVNMLRKEIERRPVAIGLASAKCFKGRQELLRFNGDGICLSLNFPRNRTADDFLNFLDKTTILVGGIPNIIKDSRLSRKVVEKTYPKIDEFRELLRDFDPKRRMQSELSKRLSL